MAWATTSDVLSITGVTVTSAQLAAAQAVIELHISRTPDADEAATVRDLYWLKQAVAWQTVWQKDQPGYTTRSATTGGDQDGARWEYTSESALLLAPLAIRALRNLSWMGNRVLSLASKNEPPPAFNLETSDSGHLWSPL